MERLTPTQKQQIRKIFYTDLVDNKQKEQTLQQKIRKKLNVEFTKKKKYAVNDFLQELDREKNLIVLVYADHVMGTKPEHSPYTDILKKKFTKEMIQFVKKLEQKKESQQLRQRQQSKLTQSKNSEIIITKDPSKKTERNVMIFVSSTVVLTVGLLLTPLMISSKK